MAKTKRLAEPAEPSALPTDITRTWEATHGTYLAGRAAIDEADKAAAECERRWGCGRLRLLVSPDLRERFDRQRYLFNQAVWHGNLEAVRQQSARMVRAWAALDTAAKATGAEPLAPAVWETTLEDGTVVAITKTPADAQHVVHDGRKLLVFTLEEVARLCAGHNLLNAVKLHFPGAEVVAVRDRGDPLDRFSTSAPALDDALPDKLPI